MRLTQPHNTFPHLVKRLIIRCKLRAVNAHRLLEYMCVHLRPTVFFKRPFFLRCGKVISPKTRSCENFNTFAIHVFKILGIWLRVTENVRRFTEVHGVSQVLHFIESCASLHLLRQSSFMISNWNINYMELSPPQRLLLVRYPIQHQNFKQKFRNNLRLGGDKKREIRGLSPSLFVAPTSPMSFLFPSPWPSSETKGTYHFLMGKPQIPFRLESYRKYELLLETIQAFCSVQSLQLIWLQFVASLSSTRSR